MYTELAQDNLALYLALLCEHIHKEDTILYPWMENNLETKQVGEMYSAFFEINNSRSEIQPKYEKLALMLEEKF